ncbi:MAG: hypothetical protein M1840_008887 [Geoglossum simile]|nr:MAG: hypothetical protein M1840_008887 [Geoglossum simile]
MGSRWLNELAEDMYSRWLSSAIACCVPRDRKVDSRPKRNAEKEMVIYHQQQPHLIPPPTVAPWAEPSVNPQSYPPPVSQWRVRSRSLASRASRASSISSFRVSKRPATAPRPSISGPSDFRRVDSFQRRGANFRPLELSIYMPENRLSPLPVFSTDDLGAQLEYPAPVVLSQRRDSLLSNSQDSSYRGNFRIARKPVAPSVTDGGRRSSDARSTPSTTGSEWLAQPLAPRPSIPGSASSQDLIAALEVRLPRSPPPLRQRSNTEPPPVLHNRDSEQYRRVWAALEERMELERKLREIGTILEEKLTDVASVSLDGWYRLSDDGQTRRLISYIAVEKEKHHLSQVVEETHPLRQLPVRPRTAPNNVTSPIHRPLPRTPLNFAQPQPSQHPPPPPPPPKVDTTVAVFRKPSLQAVAPTPSLSRKQSRSRVSNWLFSSSTPSSPMPPQSPISKATQQPFYQCTAVITTRRPSTVSISSASSTSTISSLTTASLGHDKEHSSHSEATITPQSSAPSKTSEVLLGRQRTFGAAKRREFSPPEYQEVDPNPAPKSPGVGVAF